VADWLEEGLPGRTVKTVEANRDSLRPLLAVIGRIALRDLTVEENRRIVSPLMPLISKPCPSSRAVHSRPNLRVRASSRCWATIAATAPMCPL
jgi:hypothetical protein